MTSSEQFRPILSWLSVSRKVFCYVLLLSSLLLLLLNYLAQNESQPTIKTRPIPFQFLKYLACNGFNGPSDNVQVFLQISKDLKPTLEPILIEPLFLEKILLDEERTLLLERKLMPKLNATSSLEDNIKLITFGIISHSLAEEKMCQEWVGFKCEAIYSNNRNTNKVASHFFLLKNRTLIHLVVLVKRPHFFRIEALPQNMRKPFGIQVKDHLSFGSNEQAFDSFSILRVPFDETTVSVPEESDHFLAQMDSSEFIECSRPSDGVELPPNFLSPLERKAKKGLVQMKNMMKQVKVPFWITAGTLLGWYRDCGIIGHTTDVDFATWSEFATANVTAMLKSRCSVLSMSDIFGIYEDGYEMSFRTSDDLKLDLFFVYNYSAATVKMASHAVWIQSYSDYYYPKIELCSGDLLGHKVLVPCNPESVIIADYGPNWTRPVKEWSYYKSAFNMGPMKKWPYNRPQYQAVKCDKKDK